MQDFLTDEFLDSATEQLISITQQMSSETVGIIADCIKKIGTLNPAEVNRLRNSMRIADLGKIEKELSRLTGLAIDEIENIFETVAEENEVMVQALYEYRNIDQIPYYEHKIISGIVDGAIQNAKEDFLNISETRAFNINGKITTISKAYNNAIDMAVISLSQGTTDYNVATKKIVSNLAKSGLRTIDYDSGYSRRLDSSVRMNILDGCRQMSLAMREQQAKEYGADGWEISAHALCREDHLSSQGRVFSFDEFEKLNNRLKTPIATGEYNCKHTKVGVIMAINQPAYSKDELEELNGMSTEKKKFIGLSGQELEKTKYECSQYLNNIEVSIRQMEAEKEALKRSGSIGVKKLQREINARKSEYRRICRATNIRERPERLRNYT